MCRPLPKSPDTTFNSTGKLTTDVAGLHNSFGYWVQAEANGKFLVTADVVSATTHDNFALVQYNADGSLDTSFNSTGYVITDLNTHSVDVPYQSVIGPDGKITVVGISNSDLAIVRYNPDGSLNSSFG
jgi:uncharacterized delta-60 repeat protein